MIRRRVRGMLHAVVRLRARDVTAEIAGRSALIIAPHPDDETIGCGATIMHKLAAGSTVTVLVVTDGRHSHTAVPPERQGALRRAEMAEAARRLGLPPGAVHWAGLVDGKVADDQDRLTEILVRLLDRLRPDEVYVTCADEPHPDHAAAGRAARRACATVGVPLAEYPIWLWCSWPMAPGRRLGSTWDAIRRRVVRVRLAGHADGKQHALHAYASQLGKPDEVPTDRHWDTLPGTVIRRALDKPEIFFRCMLLGPLLEFVADGSFAI
jgi:LmbE family N-acetylglucosaminyl deacetylase